MRAGTRFLPLLPLLLLMACFGLFRTLPALGQVFRGPDDVRLLGADSYYHLRHARCALQAFPGLRRWDHATHYPIGERAKTPGLLDLVLAAAALPAASALPKVAAWAPVALGLAAFVILFLLTRSLAGHTAGLLACLFLLLYPGSFLPRTALGFADHHAAEVLLALLSTWGLVHCLADSTTTRWWRPALAAALPLALFQFTWVGAPIYLALFLGAIHLLAVARLVRTGCVGNLPRVCTRHGLGLLVLLAPTGLLLPSLVMEPTFFPLIVAAAAGLVAVHAPLLLAAEACAARWKRPRLVALGLLAVAVLGLGLASLLSGGERLLDQLSGAKTPLVAEHREVTWRSFGTSHGLVGLLALAAPFAAVRPRRDDNGRTFLAVAIGAMVVALWWRTHDYGYAAGVFLALLAAVALARLLPCGRRPRVAIGVALALALLLPIWPLRWTLTPWMTSERVERITYLDDAWVAALHWMEQSTPAPTLPVDARVEPWGPGDFSYPEGTYGVWCAWDFGNFVPAIARRHVVWSQGAASHVARWLVLTDEQASIDHLDRGCRGAERVRYVIVDAKTLGDRFLAHASAAGRTPRDYQADAGRLPLGKHAITLFSYGERYSRSIAARLLYENGTGLEHYRLVFASRQQALLAYNARPVRVRDGIVARIRRQVFPIRSLEERLRYELMVSSGGVVPVEGVGNLYQGAIVPAVKVFERVRGARVVGRTVPDSSVQARMKLRAPGHRPFEYRNEVRADAQGRYELVVPYATDHGGPTSVRTLSECRVILLARGGRPAMEQRVAIPERDVQAGTRIELDLRAEDR